MVRTQEVIHKTGLEEIVSNLLEADFWGLIWASSASTSCDGLPKLDTISLGELLFAWSWECTPVVALAVWFPPLYSGRVGVSA